MKKLVPVGNKIVVQQDKANEVSKGGIHLPSPAQETPRRGVVVAVGPGKSTVTNGEVIRLVPSLKEGDIVHFTAYAGNKIKLGEHEFLLLTEDDVLATEEDE